MPSLRTCKSVKSPWVTGLCPQRRGPNQRLKLTGAKESNLKQSIPAGAPDQSQGGHVLAGGEDGPGRAGVFFGDAFPGLGDVFHHVLDLWLTDLHFLLRADTPAVVNGPQFRKAIAADLGENVVVFVDIDQA